MESSHLSNESEGQGIHDCTHTDIETYILLVFRHREVLLPKSEGRTYMLGVGRQYNTIIVSARGQHLRGMHDFESQLQRAASEVSHQVKMRFKVDRRATLDFREV